MISSKEAIEILSKYPHIIDPITNCKLAIIGIQKNGYAQYRRGKIRVYLHRLTAFAYHGLPLNSKFLALHRPECPNRHCFSETHIYVGDTSENCSDYISLGKHYEKSKMLCDHGHRLDKKMYTQRDGTVRYCSICRRRAQVKLRLSRKKCEV